MHNLIGKWVPPNERSQFASAYMGSALGFAIFFPAFGYIIVTTSWEWVYYICTVLGIIWFTLWQYFVYDSPAEHPRIHPDEKEFIENSLGNTIDSMVNSIFF